MASGFPGSIDNFTDPLTTSALNSPSHAGQHQDLNDAVEKIETYMGLVKVIPTGTNTGNTVSANGTINIGTAVSSVEIRGCFSALYDVYRIVFSNATPSQSSQDLWLQLLSATTPSTTGYYGSTLYITFTSPTATAIAQNNDTYFRVASVNDTTFRHGGALDCFMPNSAVPTLFQSTAYLSRTDISAMANTGNHRVSTAYDGFRIITSGGTITGGSIRVYGYRN